MSHQINVRMHLLSVLSFFMLLTTSLFFNTTVLFASTAFTENIPPICDFDCKISFLYEFIRLVIRLVIIYAGYFCDCYSHERHCVLRIVVLQFLNIFYQLLQSPVQCDIA